MAKNRLPIPEEILKRLEYTIEHQWIAEINEDLGTYSPQPYIASSSYKFSLTTYQRKYTLIENDYHYQL